MHVSAALLFTVLALMASPAWADADPQVLMDRAAWQERVLNGSAMLFRDPTVQRYVDGITTRLCVTAEVSPRVRVYADTDPFAFSLPNGAIYISVGLIARAQSEPELAALIAHECAAASGDATRDSKEWFGHFWIIVVEAGKRPMLTNLWSPSTIRGADEAVEQRLDAATVDLLTVAGYDAHAAAAVFSRLARDGRHISATHPFYHSDHETMQRRASSLAILAGNATSTRVPNESFERDLAPAFAWLYSQLVTFGSEAQALDLLTTEGRAEALHGLGAYYLGEAYRRRGHAGDRARAVAAYQRALDEAEPDPRALGALGRLRLAEGDRVGAAALISQYLVSRPDAVDRELLEFELQAPGASP